MAVLRAPLKLRHGQHYAIDASSWQYYATDSTMPERPARTVPGRPARTRTMPERPARTVLEQPTRTYLLGEWL